MSALPPPTHAPISAIKLALRAKQMRAQAGQILRSDPIAVVGMGCRVPGGAATPDQLWQLLSAGTDCVRQVPRSRWDAETWHDPDPAAQGKSVTKQGGFLEQIDGFDAEYFGILAREADRMDPQQRLLLEVAIEAIDHAGLPQPKLRNSRTAVYIAAYHNDYANLQLSDPDGIDARTLTGTQNSIVANRLSYLLDLRGLSLAIDSACSSSLVAVHLGCQSLRTGEADLAIAGGVSVMIQPEMMVALSRVGFLAPDGRCKTFDASADGFGRGEGCGIVVLKRLSDAIADDDRILAVIRGSAVNQDGHSTLLAAPNGIAQQALIREALETAQIEPGRIGYFEAHGTGTALGDPIEVEAIAATIGRPISPPNPCWLGSAKANFGHLEAAAGVIGLVKTILVLRHGAVPPQPNFSKLNPHISLDGTRLAVPAKLTPWPDGGLPRCAAVSSFGVGGTNANLVLEEAPRLPERARAEANVNNILPLSAQTPAALQAVVNSWADFLAETPAAIADICYTAALRRTHADHRIAVTGCSKEEVRGRLETLRSHQALGARAVSGRAPRIGLVFCGQGTQWHAMGRELMAEEAVFRDTVTACDRLLRPMADWSLREELERPEEHTRLADTEFAQPALFALQVGLAALWQSWGLDPACVIGHSVGEIAALHVAGVLALPEAIRIVWQRGQIMSPSRGGGRMAAIGLGADEAAELIASYQGRLDIAAVNGPHSVVLSGETSALEELLATLAAGGIRHRLLAGDYAFHSRQMEPLASELVRRLGIVRSSPAALTVYSTVRGGRADTVSFDAHYFGRNVREPVRFMAAMQAMFESCDMLVEIGPQPVLAASIIDCAGLDHPPPVLASLRRGQPERATMLRACAEAYAVGCDLNWARLQSGPAQIVELPHYPWQRKRHWLASSNKRASVAPTRHAYPLLGRRVPIAGVDACVFESESQAAPPWVADYRILGQQLLPLAVVIELFDAAARLSGCATFQLTGFAMHHALPVLEPTAPAVRWQVCVKPSAPDSGTLEWHVADFEASNDPMSWQCRANARLEPRVSKPLPVVDPPLLAPVPSESIYAEFAAIGATFGPAFQMLQSVERTAGFARARLQWPIDVGSLGSDGIPAVVIDAAFQLSLVAAAGFSDRALPDRLYLPLGAERIVVSPGSLAGATVRAWARLDPGTASLVADLRIAGADGSTLVEVDGLRFASAEQGQALARPTDAGRYEIAWQVASQLLDGGHAGGSWLVFSDQSGIADALSERIRAAGGRVCSVYAATSFLKRSADEFFLDAAEPESFRTLLGQAACPDPDGWRAVVHCWSLDIPGHQVDEEKADGALLGTGTILHLVQALAASPEVAIGSLLMVTRGAASVTGAEAIDVGAVRNASSWALGGVIANEHPELKPRTIDLDPQMTVQDAAILQAEICGGTQSRVAIRDGQRWVARLRRLDSDLRPLRNPASKSAPVPISPAGTYWITGGLGALGYETARWLVRGGARHLVLSSRRGNSATSPEVLRELQQAGIDYRIVAADAGDRGRMTEALAEVRRTMPPLRGVIHAAGVLHDAALINQRLKEGAEIRRGKVEGAWILHELTRDDPLDFFVLYSSAAVVLGAPGQAWYAAANAELDALAHYRRRIGLPALSVAWGPWAGGGMAAELSRRAPDTWLARGLGTIDPATGFAELERLLVDGSPYGAIIRIDWEFFLGRLPPGVDRAFFTDVSARAPAIMAAAKPDTNLPARLKAVSASQRREALMTALIAHARHVIGLDAGVPFDPAIPLREVGLDSLMAVELRNLLVQVGGKPLSATLLFDYPELDRLATYLYRAWDLDFDAVGRNEARGKAVQDFGRLAMREVASLSEAEAELLLSQELETGGMRRSR